MTGGRSATVAGLRTFAMFERLSDAALKAIAQRATMRRMARNDIVVRAGDATDSVYLVLSGQPQGAGGRRGGQRGHLLAARSGRRLRRDERARRQAPLGHGHLPQFLHAGGDHPGRLHALPARALRGHRVHDARPGPAPARRRPADRKPRPDGRERARRAAAAGHGGNRRRQADDPRPDIPTGYRQNGRRLARDGEPRHEGSAGAGADRGKRRPDRAARPDRLSVPVGSAECPRRTDPPFPVPGVSFQLPRLYPPRARARTGLWRTRSNEPISVFAAGADPAGPRAVVDGTGRGQRFAAERIRRPVPTPPQRPVPEHPRRSATMSSSTRKGRWRSCAPRSRN
ncbi:MAG: cyclic nucleotide-binding domain-containing protein [Desulfosudis oleivorans]|nr:cyclic nucleotide-binding domain-containing protein [Desulfosudis oleivorans]